ncbi:sulfotransferase [Aestuariicella sp. G3-2]|uniref:sulfotransferase family protein n=1 Tax=Pseudomaricurvus albidus TaxID=2842452 RepID=UPI001C0B02EB|nr:sulfotransferase [Aestuariicella albida]MBU3071676.1 sulfotransferase [Aestuariicella albida]
MSDLNNHEGLRPVFIGGCGRSGTTMLASLLGAVEGAVVTPESQFKIDYLYDERNTLNYKNLWRLKTWDLSIDRFKELARTSASKQLALESLVREYSFQHSGSVPCYWIDHTPDNIRYVDLLLENFKVAKFINIVRDGRAVASSMMRLKWGADTIYEASEWWRERVALGFAAEHAFPDRVMTVSYEKILNNPEGELRRLCEFIGIKYTAKMLQGTGFRMPDYRREQHLLVGSPPDSSRIEAWKSELMHSEIEIFETISSQYLKALGYQLSGADIKRSSVGSVLKRKLQVRPFILSMMRKVKGWK